MRSSDELLGLQQIVLRAVLLGQPLPGSSQSVRLPDLSFVLRHQVVFLAAENLSGPIAIEDAPKPISILSTEGLLQETLKHGDIAYLRFQPTEANDDRVRITLEAKIATSDPNKGLLGLSSIHVTFSKDGDAWKVADGPVYSAA